MINVMSTSPSPIASGRSPFEVSSAIAVVMVGTVMIVGGNIAGFTRTMTTAIALETSKGDLPLAMGLGLVLITLIIAVNALAWGARRVGEIRAG